MQLIRSHDWTVLISSLSSVLRSDALQIKCRERTRQTKPGRSVSEWVCELVLIPGAASTPPSLEASFFKDCSGFPHSPQFTPPPLPGCLTTAAAVKECLPYNVTHISKSDRALLPLCKEPLSPRWSLSEPGSRASLADPFKPPSLTYSWRPALLWFPGKRMTSCPPWFHKNGSYISLAVQDSLQ